MTALLLLAVAALLPPEATQVRLDRQRWVIEGEAGAADSVWWWSAKCAPQKLRHGETPRCEATREVGVQVIDGTERPVSGAIVRWATEAMLRDLPDDRLPQATTSGKGTASVALPADTEVWMRVAGPRAATYWRRVSAKESAVRFGAFPSATTLIRLRGEDGSEVSRAHVALLPPSCSTVCAERLLALGDGKSAPELVTVAGASYRLVVWSESHAPATTTITATGEGIDVTLARGATLAARLVDGERKPLRDARLEVELRLPELRETIRRTAVAAADGAIHMGGLPAGPVEWTATADGRARRVNEAQLESGAHDLGEVELSPARRARVLVVDRDRVPVPGARVVARGCAAAITDGKGVVTFDALPAGDVGVQVDAAAFLRAQASIPADDSKVVVMLERGAGVKAALIRQADGRPPTQVQVRITNNGTESLRTMEVKGDLVVTGLRPGSIRLRIAADGAQPFDSGTLRVAAGVIADLGVVVLQSGVMVRGIVVDEHGAPVAGARVRALRTDGDAPALAHVLGNWREVVSADDGSFHLGGLTPGVQLLVIEAQRFARHVLSNLSAEAGSGEIDLGTIELRKGTRVELVCRPAARCGTEARLMLAGSDFPFLAIRTPLEEGRGTFHAVPPGEMMLRLSRREHIVHEESVGVERDNDPQRIEIALPSTRVRGHVTIGGDPARGGSLLLTRPVRSASVPILVRSETQNGSSVGSEWLGSFGAATACSVTDTGVFSIDEIEPGEYEVTFRNGGGATAPIDIRVADVREQNLDLRFDAYGIAGVVLDAAGRPVAARLTIVDGARATHTTNAGIDGQFQILGLSGGRATVKATASGRVAKTEVDPSHRDAKSLVLRLTEEESGGITVAVGEPGGGPAAGVLVFAMSRGGLLVMSTDSEGRAVFRGADDEGEVPVAAHRPGGSWAFGTARATSPSRVVMPSRSGTVTARFATSGTVAITAPSGFPLDRILPMVGLSPQVPAGGTLRLAGLPPASYGFTAGMLYKNVTVSAGETAVVEFGH